MAEGLLIEKIGRGQEKSDSGNKCIRRVVYPMIDNLIHGI